MRGPSWQCITLIMRSASVKREEAETRRSADSQPKRSPSLNAAEYTESRLDRQTPIAPMVSRRMKDFYETPFCILNYRLRELLAAIGASLSGHPESPAGIVPWWQTCSGQTRVAPARENSEFAIIFPRLVLFGLEQCRAALAVRFVSMEVSVVI